MEEEEDLGRTLRAAFATVPDTRDPHGRRHPLPAILALATAAMLSGARSLYAIGQWGRLQRPAVLQALGFRRTASPSVSTIHVVFQRLDVAAFAAALAAWAQQQAGTAPVMALDGKGLRGIHGEQLPGIRLVAAYAEGADGAGQVLAQVGGQDRRA